MMLRLNAQDFKSVRRGNMSWPVVIVVVSLGLLGLLLWSLLPLPAVSPPLAPAPAPIASTTQLVMFCAASNHAVMETVRKDYQAETGIEVQVQYGASQTLLASIEVSKSGDLFLPADDSFLIKARDKKLVANEYALADMHAVVAVPKGNPLGIRTLDDLLTKDLRLAQGNTETTGIGVVTQRVLRSQGRWEALKERTAVFKTTVNDVANDVKLNAADVGIAYDVVLRSYDTLEAITIPELKEARSRIGVCTLTTSDQPAAAERFARYLSARDKGLKRYAEHGFQPVEGADWATTP